jgi:hypothetical protein
MPGDDKVQEPFYFDEVIGSALSYHRPTCHIVEQIRRRNYKRLRNWEEAVSLGPRTKNRLCQAPLCSHWGTCNQA